MKKIIALIGLVAILGGCSTVFDNDEDLYGDLEATISIGALLACDSQREKISPKDMVDVVFGLQTARAILTAGSDAGDWVSFTTELAELGQISSAQAQAISIAVIRLVDRIPNDWTEDERVKLAVTAVDFCLTGLGQPIDDTLSLI